MIRLTRSLALALLLALLASCATYPKGEAQILYSAGWTLVGATNSVADLHDAGLLKGEDYEKAKLILDRATDIYHVARQKLRGDDPQGAAAQAKLLLALLEDLAKFLDKYKER